MNSFKLNILLVSFLFSLSVGANPIVSDGIVTLSDEPSIQFVTSGWNYTNTPNPFLLTPDYLTNAMLGVSRIKSGEPFLNEGPTVPDKLNTEGIEKILKDRLKSKENLKVRVKNIQGRPVVIAEYTGEGKQKMEAALALKNCLIHILLIAKPGDYYDSGVNVFNAVLNSLKPL